MSDHNGLARIVARVDPADVAAEMVAKFRADIASYRRLPETVVMGQIFDVSLRNVELFFRSVTDGVEPSGEELVALRASARNRASEGMPLEDLLHAYRVGGRLGWRALLAAAEGPEEHRALLGAAELLMRYVDQVSAAVARSPRLARLARERVLGPLESHHRSGSVVTLALKQRALDGEGEGAHPDGS